MRGGLLARLQRHAARPAVFAPHAAPFWDDACEIAAGSTLRFLIYFDFGLLADTERGGVFMFDVRVPGWPADADRRITASRLLDRAYSPETVIGALESSGFRVEELWVDLACTPYRPGAPAFAVSARKGLPGAAKSARSSNRVQSHAQPPVGTLWVPLLEWQKTEDCS